MAEFAPGVRVRVKNYWPETQGPVHIRTPHYVRGLPGTVVRWLGAFPNPEDLAFGRPAPQRTLYHVVFDQPGDQLLVELYEHWLEPA